MSAVTFNLTNTPVKISDGTKSVYVQEIRGKHTRFTCSPTAPDINTVTSCVILDNDISVANGFPLWAWTEGDPIQISVLISET